MEHARSTASRARRRHALSIFVPAFGFAASIASGIALALVIADRLFGLGMIWWTPVIIVLAGGVLWGTWCVSRRALSPAGAAAVIDERLALHDSISSAIELEDKATHDPFAAMALEQGERAAAEADIRRAIPIPIGREQAAWPAMVGASVALVLFAPQFDLLGAQRTRRAEIVQAQHTDDARQAINEAGELIDQFDERDPDQSDAGPQEDNARDLLEELDRQLAQQEITPDEARSKASSALSEAAQRATDNAQRQAQREEALREMIANASDASPGHGADGGAESEGSRAIDALREALASGDLDAASEALDELDHLPPDQQQIAAEELEKLADQLQQLAELEERAAREQAQQQLEHLQDAGLDEETAQQIAEMRQREQIEQELREQGADEETAQRLAEQAEQDNRERESKEQSSEDAKDAADAAQQTADQLREEPETPEKQEETTPQDNPEQQESPGEMEQLGAPGENADPNVDAPTSEQSKPGQDPLNQDKQGQQPGEGAQEPQPGAQGEHQQSGEQSGEQTGDQQGEGAQEQQPGAQDGQPQPGDQPGEGAQGEQQGAQAGEGEGQEQPGAREGGAGEDAQRVGAGEVDPEAEDAQRLGGSPEDAEGDGAGGKPKDMQEMIEQMRDARERIAEDRARADKYREQAEKMLQDMSPEQREEMERWARQALIEEGAPSDWGHEYETEAIDARTETDSMEVRDEWFNPDGEFVRDGAVSREEMIESLRTAAEGYERAIEEQRVPARYRNVRRYFERALERAENNEESTAPEGALGDG